MINLFLIMINLFSHVDAFWGRIYELANGKTLLFSG